METLVPADDDQASSSLADSARRQLESLIEAGALMPGDSIDVKGMAERLGMSRTPVRDAIQQLQLQGLVQIVPRQGIYVARASIKTLLAMFELLAEYEGVCAKFAARRIDSACRERLTQALEACRSANAEGDHTKYSAANTAFHQAIYDASSNSFLVEHVVHLRRRTQMYRRDAFQQPGRMQTSLADHERLAAAVLAGDAERATAEAIAHISVGGKGFADFVSTLPDSLLDR